MRPDLHVTAIGAGEPTFLFVHGFGCTHEDWQFQTAALSADFQCVALDLPGHGRSAMPAKATMIALAAAVNDAKAQVGARRVVLVGHSLGCKVIRDAYYASSADVVGLVFIEGAFYDGDREVLIRRAGEAIDSEGFAAFAHRHFGAMFIEGSDPRLRERVLARVTNMDPTFGRDLYLEAVGWDPLRGRQTLLQITVPVLVLQSTYIDARLQRTPLHPDMKTPFMEVVGRLVPQAELKVISGCGHFPLVEAAHVVNSELRLFASRIARTNRS